MMPTRRPGEDAEAAGLLNIYGRSTRVEKCADDGETSPIIGTQ